MRLNMRAVLSLVLGVGGVVSIGAGLSPLLDFGSCASGGPYVIARECPDGTGGSIALLVAGLVAFMAGLMVSEQGLTEPGTGQAVWTIGFAGGGTALLLKALLQPDLPGDSKLGILIVAAVSIPMGLAVGIGGLVQRSRQRRRVERRRRPRPDVDMSTPWMQRLLRMRSTGLLTRDEFERLRDDDGAADLIDMVHHLAELRENGTLSAEEFDEHKGMVIPGDRA